MKEIQPLVLLGLISMSLSLSGQAKSDTNSRFGFEALYLLDYRADGQLEALTGTSLEVPGRRVGAGLAFHLKYHGFLFRVFGQNAISGGREQLEFSSAGLQLGYEYPLTDKFSFYLQSGFRIERGVLEIALDTSGMQATGMVPNVIQWQFSQHFWQSDINFSYWFQQDLPFFLPRAISLNLAYSRGINPARFWFSGNRTRMDYDKIAFSNQWQVGLRLEWNLRGT